MALPSEVNNVQIKDSFEFDRSNHTVAFQQWTYFVGDHGPFTKKFYANEQQPAHVERVISDHVAQLRLLGVI